jgi:predicted outer membrane protein
MLLIDNHNEIATAQLAEQRSKSEDVKKFAKQMIEDRSKFIEKLRPRASQYANVIRNADGADRGPATQSTQGGALDIMQLKQRLGQNAWSQPVRSLKAKKAQNSITATSARQVGEHMKLVDTLEVFQQYASPDLKAVLQEGLQTAQKNLKHAKK